MPKTNPWHSKAQPSGPYHNNTSCTEGNNIEARNRVSGTGGKPLCKRCSELNSQGK